MTENHDQPSDETLAEQYNAYVEDNLDQDETPRAYIIGLPVSVTVYADGTVKLLVDAGEISRRALFESVDMTDVAYTDEQVAADAVAIDYAFNNKTFQTNTMHQES